MFIFIQINDKPDFLQGDLQENVQHTQLICKRHCSSIESLLFNSTSIALIPNKSYELQGNNFKSLSLSSSLSSSNIPKVASLESTEEFNSSRNCKSLNTSPQSSLTEESLKFLKHASTDKIKKGKSKKSSSGVKLKSQSTTSQKSSRPLPKPVSGTEKLTASYTQAHLQKELKKVKLSTDGSTSKSISFEDVHHQKTNNHIPVYLNQKHLLPSSSSHLNQSWNDIIKAEQLKCRTPMEKHENIDSTSANLNSSLSSKLIKLMKTSRENINESDNNLSTSDAVMIEGSAATISSNNTSNNIHKEKYEEYVVDVYSVSKGSILFKILEESWIYSSIVSIKTFSFIELNNYVYILYI